MVMDYYYRHSNNVYMQWNPSIAATLGEQYFGRYIGVAFIEGLFFTQTGNDSNWPLFRGDR